MCEQVLWSRGFIGTVWGSKLVCITYFHTLHHFFMVVNNSSTTHPQHPPLSYHSFFFLSLPRRRASQQHNHNILRYIITLQPQQHPQHPQQHSQHPQPYIPTSQRRLPRWPEKQIQNVLILALVLVLATWTRRRSPSRADAP